MKKDLHNKFRQIMSIMVLVCMLSGCSDTLEIKKIEPITAITTITKEKTRLEKQTLEEPVSRVHLMIDKRGYTSKDKKRVFIVDSDEKEEFKLVNKNTKEIVFQGETFKNGEVYAGDFSEIESEGEYYVETKKLGRSYTVRINDNVWKELFDETLQVIEAKSLTAEKDEVMDAVLSMHVLFFALQSYPEVFEQDNNMITWLLKTANSMMEMQSEDGSYLNDFETTAVVSGIMLLCADKFGKYDEQLANSFKEASEKAEGWMNTTKSDIAEDAYFYYMCQRFRMDKLTGSYKIEIEDYIKKNIDVIADDYFRFLGSMLYINSEKNTDRDICTSIMQSIVSRIEKISEQGKKREFYVDSSSLENIMREALLVCFIDYITPSREYMEIIKNTMHFLCGANINNEIVLQNEEEMNTFWSSICIFCLADINN